MEKGMDIVVDVHELTRAFPRHELYGLTSQTRRAAVSIPSNIAEGNGRFFRREYTHHVSIARGSVAEVATCLAIAQRLGYVSAEAVRAEEVSRMLLMLMRALNRPVQSRTER